MPFGWVGFDAQMTTKEPTSPRTMSPMPFGWVGFDATMGSRWHHQQHQAVSNAFRLGGL